MLRGSAVFSYLFVAIIIFASCDREDPGPLQEKHKSYAVVDFDRLEIGSGLNIQVDYANTFSVEAKGDRRNVDDLEVLKSGNTLTIRFDDDGERHHDTYLYITMPAIESANFAGASVSRVRGFDGSGNLDLYVSAASVSQLDSRFASVNAVVSGASKLVMFGNAEVLNVEISGASSVKAFDFPVNDAVVNLSGASDGRISASGNLNVTASGASVLIYRGDAVVTAETSGSSQVKRD
jgi:hypothetical protein